MSTQKKLLPIGLQIRSLCTRCGTCVGASTDDSLVVGNDLYPKAPNVDYVQAICGAVSPGASVNFQELCNLTFGDQPDTPTFDGYVQATYIGYCTDDKIRSGGAGGGVVTGLLWDMLKNNEVDGCIVARMDPTAPWLGKPYIARTHEELLWSQGSKYTIIPLNAILKEVRDLPGHFAYAGLPCQVHGIRKLMQLDPVIREKIKAVIGLFCGGALEPHFVTEMLQTRGIKPQEIKDFQFRGGQWPGKMRAILRNGSVKNLHYSNYKDGAYNYFSLIYTPKRCQTCTDGSGHFSDVSVSDAWTRDSVGNYKFKNQSRMLVRTNLGMEIVEKALRHGTIVAQDVSKDSSYQTHRIQTRRKGSAAPLRVERLKRKKIPVPIYDRPLPDATPKEVTLERLGSMFLFLGQYKWFRYSLMKLLTSKYSIPLIKIRVWLKKRKYRKG